MGGLHYHLAIVDALVIHSHIAVTVGAVLKARGGGFRPGRTEPDGFVEHSVLNGAELRAVAQCPDHAAVGVIDVAIATRTGHRMGSHIGVLAIAEGPHVGIRGVAIPCLGQNVAIGVVTQVLGLRVFGGPR